MFVYQRQRLGCERCLIVFKLTAIIYILLSVFAIEKISLSFLLFSPSFLISQSEEENAIDIKQLFQLAENLLTKKVEKTLYLKIDKPHRSTVS